MEVTRNGWTHGRKGEGKVGKEVIRIFKLYSYVTMYVHSTLVWFFINVRNMLQETRVLFFPSVFFIHQTRTS